jgi:hypothetical protein
MSMTMMLVIYTGAAEPVLLTGANARVIAVEDEVHLLTEMGNKLLKENIISCYQLIVKAGPLVVLSDIM